MNQRVTLIFFFLTNQVQFESVSQMLLGLKHVKQKQKFLLKAVTLNRKWKLKAVGGFYRIGVTLYQPEIRT